MKILGYSERGLINSLLYEIAFCDSSKQSRLVKDLFSSVIWPRMEPRPGTFDNCKVIFIEQSFSDFGDADGVFLFESGDSSSVVFFEGKRGADYSIKKAWEKFVGAYWSKARVRGQTSNLFCQLYFKQRLSKALRQDSGESIEEGILFEEPFNLPNRARRIGDNPVVLAATDQVRAKLGGSYYLMMIPECWTPELHEWWNTTVANEESLPTGFDSSRFGVLTIPKVVEFCRANELARTLEVIEYNSRQLYISGITNSEMNGQSWLERHGRQGVGVVYAPSINSSTALHFSWRGDRCALRDYSQPNLLRPPLPDRSRCTSEVFPLIERFSTDFKKAIDVGSVLDWKFIISRHNSDWKIVT